MDSLPVTTASASDTSSRVWADSVGMMASIACAIHCAAMPLVISYLPLLGLSWLADESFHKVMAVICFGLAALAFVPGWKKHGSLIPVATGIAGVGLLSLAAFGLEGSCCPTCDTVATDTPQAEVTLVAVTKADALASDGAEPACVDSACQLCAREGGEQSVAAEPANSLASWAVPLMTPFGGVLLVMGHLVNHRKSCQCKGDACCL